VGTSGEPRRFTREIVQAMAEYVERPLVFPLSNPTSQSEAIPADVLEWTDGRALVATGSPFPPVPWGGTEIRIGQANNAFVFPGVGLGVLVSEARTVTDEMFAAAAVALATYAAESDPKGTGALFPPVSSLREVTARVAEAVVRAALDAGVARARVDDPARAVAGAMWEPDYLPLDPVPPARAAELAFAEA
jgi:malate dehydrogenase (oxaloacetate-decarboxylating)